ncbi:hypothetical protein AB1Y20_006495 [Prymnesium parvum]|uniref:Centrosomal protein of 162 kDa n=1 Tax=Prymnesium parvum TaxID=97485 RepID=A0AB34J0H2_PRYPA
MMASDRHRHVLQRASAACNQTCRRQPDAPPSEGRERTAPPTRRAHEKDARATVSYDALLSENQLLGCVVDELRDAVARREAAARQAEDALLELHHEGERTKEALLRERAELARARALLGEAVRAAHEQQQRAREAGAEGAAVELLLLREVAAVDELLLRQGAGAEAQHAPPTPAQALSAQVGRLRSAAAEAVRGMNEAQAECAWLHQQMQQLLREAAAASPSCGAQLKLQLRHALRGGGEAAGGEANGVPPRSGAEAAAEAAASSSAAYYKAVQRCHQLQSYVSELAQVDSKVRPQLLHAQERLAELHKENVELRLRLARSEGRAGACVDGEAEEERGGGEGVARLELSAKEERVVPRLANPTSGAADDESSTLRRQVSRLEAQAMAREAELHEAVAARVAAERARAAAEDAMATEMSWARSLDEMRLLDLAAIQQLENKLAQWGIWHHRSLELPPT